MIHWVTAHDHLGSHARINSPDNGSHPRSAKNKSLNSASSFSHPRCPHTAYVTRMFARHHRGTETGDADVAQMQQAYHHHPHDCGHAFIDDDLERGRGSPSGPHWEGKRDSRFAERESSPLSEGLPNPPSSTTRPRPGSFITCPEWLNEDPDVPPRRPPPASPVARNDRMSRYSNVATDRNQTPEAPRSLPLVCRRTGMSPGV